MEERQPTTLAALVESIKTLQGQPLPLESLHDGAESACARVESLFAADKLAEAFATVDSLERSVALYGEKDSGAVESANVVMEAHSRLFEGVKRDFGALRLCCERYLGEEGWQLAKVGKSGIRTFFRHDEGEPTVSIKVAGAVNAPLLNLIALVYENELWKEMFERLTHCDTVRELDRFSKVIYLRGTAPGPISARDGFIKGQGFDLIESHGAVVILARDASPEEVGQDPLPPTTHGDVRMHLTVACCVVIPRSPTSCELTVVANANPFLPVIPYWLINWVTKQVAAWLFEMMAERAANLPDKYRERIAANPRVYGEVIARLKKYNLMPLD